MVHSHHFIVKILFIYLFVYLDKVLQNHVVRDTPESLILQPPACVCVYWEYLPHNSWC